MATVGAALAEVYVLRKRQVEKLKKMEKERAKTEENDVVDGDGALEEMKPSCCFLRKGKKIHPSAIPISNSVSTSQVLN